MKPREGLPVAHSPMKTVSFQRGNSRVLPLPSPRGTLTRLRPSIANQKYLAAQQQARKASNPIKMAAADEDEWQDVDDNASQAAPLLDWPELKPPPQHKADMPDFGAMKQATQSTTSKPTTAKSTAARTPAGQSITYSSENPSQSDSTYPGATSKQPSSNVKLQKLETTPETSEITEDTTSMSFLNFSPTSAGASFIRKLGRQGRRLKPKSWRWHDDSLEDDMARSTTFQSQFSPGLAPIHGRIPYQQQQLQQRLQQQHPQQLINVGIQKSNPFWMNPALPGLIALYLQVAFNMIMVFTLLYAIGVFYTTIRNDVNLKVEEYSVDIVDQISKCSFEYLRNGCEPGKRVPAIESVCQQWERCMQRDPKEVGRAKVSAETFGTIIEAFIQPIGFKSMIFLTVMFAGSFLLVNAVFSSRIGPRFNSSHQQHFQQPAFHQPPPAMTQSQPVDHNQQPTPVASFQPQYLQSQPGVVYTPAHIPSPQYRNVPLQSSPVRHSPYRF